MAKQKRKAKSAPRRRRISGTGNVDFALIGGLIAGAVGSKFMDKVPGLSTMDGKIKAAAKIAAGIFLPKIAGRSPMVAAIGMGMVAGGGLQLVGSEGLNLISGIGEDDVLRLELPSVNGMSEIDTVSGIGDDIETISGIGDDDLQY